MSFYLCWGISALVLLFVTGWAGRKAKFAALSAPTSLGILIDVRERFSLNRLQLVMWTLLILSTFLGLLFSNLSSDPTKALDIPKALLGLLGISAGSATVAGAVKDGKDATRPERIAGGKGFLARSKVSARVEEQGLTAPDAQDPEFVQVFLEEEGTQGANQVVSVTKFQHLIFTVALGVIYVVLTIKNQTYPVLDENVLWLIGISHAGYIGGKVPNKD